MAIQLDKHARSEVARRRAGGRDAQLVISIWPLRGMNQLLRVNWAGHNPRTQGLLQQQVGDTVVYVPKRLARYARWHNVTITAWRVGPFACLGIVDELLVVVQMRDWEHAHPGSVQELNAW